MKIAIITDTHAGVRGDNRFLKLRQEQFYKDVFFPYIDDHNIQKLIHLGDLFDRRKYVNFDTLGWWNRVFMDELNKRNISCDFIAGNHDTYHKSSNTINSLRELYSVSNYETMNFYWDKPVTKNYDGLDICLAPWLAPDNEQRSLAHIAKTKATVLMGHFELTGFVMGKGQLCDHGLDAELFSRFHSVFSGHFHTKSTGKNVTYLGSPYEMTWNDYGDRKGFHLFDTETLELEFIENPIKSFYKLKYEDSDLTVGDIPQLDFSGLTNAFVKVIVINKTNPYLFDLFMDKVNQVNPADIKIVDDNKHMDDLSEQSLVDETESTETILSKYVDGLELGEGFDKNVLKKFMLNLYSEALAL